MTDSELFDVKYPPTDQDVEDSMTLPSEAGEGLKACPFCSGAVGFLNGGPPETALKWVEHRGILCPASGIHKTEYWNRRATPTGKALTDEKVRNIRKAVNTNFNRVLNPALNLIEECESLVRAIASALHQQGLEKP